MTKYTTSASSCINNTSSSSTTTVDKASSSSSTIVDKTTSSSSTTADNETISDEHITTNSYDKNKGVYFLSHPFYKNVIKIGSSGDIKTRIHSGDYRTMFLPQHRPQLLGQFSHPQFQHKNELLYAERAIHRFLSEDRICDHRELFHYDYDDVEQQNRLHAYWANFSGKDHRFVRYDVEQILDEHKIVIARNNQVARSDAPDQQISDSYDHNTDSLSDESPTIHSHNQESVVIEQCLPSNNQEHDTIQQASAIAEQGSSSGNQEHDTIQQASTIAEQGLSSNNPQTTTWQPLSHQLPIIDAINNFFINHTHGKLILPCAMGKSYISLFHIKDSDHNNVVIFVPSLILMEQFFGVAKDILIAWNVICFNGRYKMDIDVIDDENSSMDCDIDILRNKNLIISTYQSSLLLNEKLADVVVDLVIYDEAHRTCVSKVKGSDSLFNGTIHMFPNAKKMFMTATEKISVTNKVNEDVEYYSMDGQEYGNYIVRKTFVDAIEEGIISDYTLAIPLTNSFPVDVVISAFKELPINHLLIYANKCADGKAITEQLNSSGITSFYLDGTLNKKQRWEVIDQFTNCERAALVSVKVLTEGFSVPKIDGIYFLANRTSEIQVTQMLGRGLRLHKDKTLCTIIVPSDMIKNRPLLSNIALMDSRKIKTIGFSAGKTCCRENLDKTILKRINQQILFYQYNRIEDAWKFKYDLCREYEALYPDKKIKKYCIYKDTKINGWLSYNQYAQRIGIISSEKLAMLENLRSWIPYNPVVNEVTWMDKYILCVEYENLDANNVIKINVISKGIKLHNWLTRNKCRHSHGTLPDDRLSLLEKLRSWKPQEGISPEDKWMYRYNLCREYEALNPGQKIKTNLIYKDIKIYSWIIGNRVTYKEGKLSDGRLKLLEQLRSWNPNLQMDPNSFELASRYEKEMDNIITDNTKYEGVDIGLWLKNCKSQYGKGKLTKKEIETLQTLKSWSEFFPESRIKIGSWSDGYALVSRWYSMDTNVKITSKTMFENYNIGNWIYLQRKRYINNTMSNEELEKMSIFQFWKDFLIKENIFLHSDDINWTIGYKLVKNYQKENPDATEIKKGVMTSGEYNKAKKWIEQNMRHYKRLKNDVETKNNNSKKSTSMVTIACFTKKREDRLQKLNIWKNFIINENKEFDSIFTSKIMLLLEYETMYPDIPIDNDTIHQNVNIGFWMKSYIQHYKRRKNSGKIYNDPRRLENLNKLKVWRDFMSNLQK